MQHPVFKDVQPLAQLFGLQRLLDGCRRAGRRLGRRRTALIVGLRAGLLALPQDGIEAAKLSGASPRRVLCDIILPLSTPGLIAGAAISFVSNVGNFGIPAILGALARGGLLHTGVATVHARTLADAIAAEPRLRLRGLMAIPAPFPDQTRRRAAFVRMRGLFEALRARYPGVDTLSMGMSGDFALAIAEGATMVRVGTALFGERQAS